MTTCPNQPALRAICTALLFCPATATAWTPGTGQPAAVDGFTVDATSRRDVLAFHHTVYEASEGFAADMAWTGSVGAGNEGTTSATFKDHVRRRVNYYRALAGLPADIVFDATKSAKSQKAALMMSANRSLSHFPPASWNHYSADGYEAAGSSNLSYGSYGPDAVDDYMFDFGAGNEIVGHRRWILYSRAAEMGTGDIPKDGTYAATNSLWTIGDFKSTPAPSFVAWPNEGWIPGYLVPDRWSLSYPGANFGSANVTMTIDGTPVATTVISRTANGYGDNTLVWEPASVPWDSVEDVECVVNVTGISGSGVPTSKNYTVRFFDPEVLGEEITVSGPASPGTGGADYAFTPIAQADAYQVEVTRLGTDAWTEGAEDSPAPRISTSVSAGYSVLQSGLVRTGAKAFQLTFPPGQFGEQSFTITRDIIPTADSVLSYHDRARWSSPSNVLHTQISTDGGATWTTLASRTGVSHSGSSSEWETSWNARAVGLSGYAGQIVRLRFRLVANGSAFTGTSVNHGFFLDDISVSNSLSAQPGATTQLSGGATAFTLDETTAGAPLVDGTTYLLRVRPNVGTHWFPYGEQLQVTVAAAAPAGFTSWAASWEATHSLPAGTLADPYGDHDKDGRNHLLEYAFGGSPVSPDDSAARLPVCERLANHVVLRYQVDTTQGDIQIVPEASGTAEAWKAPGESGAPSGFEVHPLETSDGIETREAVLPLASGSGGFLRLRVTRM